MTVGTPVVLKNNLNISTNLARPTNDVIKIQEAIAQTGSYIIPTDASSVILDGTLTSYITVLDAIITPGGVLIWSGSANQNIPSGTYNVKAKLVNNRNFTGSFNVQQDVGITQSPPPTASAVDNNTFHVLAGAYTGEFIHTQSEGFNLFGTASIFADFWKLDGTPNTTINYEIGGTDGSYINSSSTNNTMSLFLKDNISGNFAPGDTLNFAITSSDFYNNSGS